MATYAVTFRISAKTVNGKTYIERYSSFMEKLYSKSGYWEETTSFALTISDKSTQALVRHLSQDLSATEDLVVAFDPSDMSSAYFGNLEHKDVLASFFNTCTKV